MPIFGGGFIRDSRTGRPVAGKVVQVVDPTTDLPVDTVVPVVTRGDGYYDDFETTDGPDVVRLVAGDRVQHAVAVGKIFDPAHIGTSVTVVDNGNGTITLQDGA